MSLEVFVDTSAWVAVIDAHDKYHAPAREAYSRLIGERRTLITTNMVIAETYILVRRTGGHAQAMRLLHSLRGSPRLQKVRSDAGLESRAVDILERHSDQDFSYADAVSFAIMLERGVEEAFTFDKHFAAMGFRVVPGGKV